MRKAVKIVGKWLKVLIAEPAEGAEVLRYQGAGCQHERCAGPVPVRMAGTGTKRKTLPGPEAGPKKITGTTTGTNA